MGLLEVARDGIVLSKDSREKLIKNLVIDGTVYIDVKHSERSGFVLTKVLDNKDVQKTPADENTYTERPGKKGGYC